MRYEKWRPSERMRVTAAQCLVGSLGWPISLLLEGVGKFETRDFGQLDLLNL